MRRYQDIAHDLHRHIVELTKAGEFRGHLAARSVMVWYAMNISNTHDPANGLRRGFVMEGCISQAATAAATGLDKATVSRSIGWLEEQGFIQVRREYQGKRQRIARVEISSFDAESEDDRKAALSRPPLPLPATSKKRPRLRLVVNE